MRLVQCSRKHLNPLLAKHGLWVRHQQLAPLKLVSRAASSVVSTTKRITLDEAWPRLQERFEARKNDQGKIKLLNTKQQTVIDKQVAPSDRSAAVLVLLISVEGQPSLLFTRRSAHLSQHAAEISFPGGHFEKENDETLIDTAIREAVEELYAESNDPQPMQTRIQAFRDQLHLLGPGTFLPSIRGVPVTPVLAAMLDQDLPLPVTKVWPGDRSEVDLVFTVSLQELVEVETTHTLPKSRFGFVSTEAPVFPTAHGVVILQGVDDDITIASVKDSMQVLRQLKV